MPSVRGGLQARAVQTNIVNLSWDIGGHYPDATQGAQARSMAQRRAGVGTCVSGDSIHQTLICKL